MKKYCLLLSLALGGFACGNQTDSAKTPAETADTVATTPATTSVMDNPDYDKGLNLIAKSDCFTCHKLREQATGPAYGAVAAKYENTPANQEMLAGKVIAGGSGVWGQVPMTPHPNVSKEDAISMVKYIMLLKEEAK